MRVSTEGIVLQRIRYGDNSSVVKIYTRQGGMQSFMLKSGSRSGGRFRSSCFFPLSQVEISYSSARPGAGMSYLSEVKIAYAYREMYADVRKSSVAFFLAEMMVRCITQSEQDEVFYDKVARALRRFDLQSDNLAEFHLFFVLEMASALGFYPLMAEGASVAYFDLREGRFVQERPIHADFLQGGAAADLVRLLDTHVRSGGDIPFLRLFSSSERFALLQALVRYCQLQSGTEGTFKSLAVLREIFS